MEMTLEVVVVPVSDVDRAKRFYADQMGFHVDTDSSMPNGFRIVQMTPPGSGCSVTIGTGLAEMEPGSLKGLQLCVTDLAAARAELLGRGVELSEVRHVDMEKGTWEPGPGGPWNSFVFFDDPDGNSWAIQEVPPDRTAPAGGPAAEAAV
jgi:catechol 2,3-dioxygenase-like lactoylglutathione lyase family enzyme